MILLGLLDSIKTWMKVTLVVRSKFFFWVLPSSCLTCMVIVSLNASNGFIYLWIWNDADDSHLFRQETSIAAGIPVISISLGCSARFLYQPNTEPLDNAPISSTLLRSGDIFIFGSKARGLKHGVQKIFPKTAPKKWQEIGASNGGFLGRLNLTFRQTR